MATQILEMFAYQNIKYISYKINHIIIYMFWFVDLWRSQVQTNVQDLPSETVNWLQSISFWNDLIGIHPKENYRTYKNNKEAWKIILVTRGTIQTLGPGWANDNSIIHFYTGYWGWMSFDKNHKSLVKVPFLCIHV